MSDRAYAKAQAQQKTLTGSSPKSNLLQRTCACGRHTIAGTLCSTCRSEQSTLLRSQRAFEPFPVPAAVPGSSPAEVKAPLFNSTFGHDFSQIPIHSPAARVIQKKLAINRPGDIYEQEADRISEQVMRMPEPQLQRACDCGGACSKCQTEQSAQEHERLQTKRKQDSNTEQISVPPAVHEVLGSPGQPLDSSVRAFMEPRFGHNFSNVRVHTDAKAAESAGAVNALAYTVGRDVVFGQGQYSPEESSGRRLLAHELTHIMQQTVIRPTGSTAPIQRQAQPREDRYIPPSATAGRLVYAEEIFQNSREVRPLSDANFTNIFYDRNKVIVVDFWASWCRPCDDAAAHVAYLARRYASGPYAGLVKFYHVQLEDSVNPQLNKRFGFDAIPVVYFYYTGTGRQPSHQAPLLEGSIQGGDASIEDYEWRIRAILRRHGLLSESKDKETEQPLQRYPIASKAGEQLPVLQRKETSGPSAAASSIKTISTGLNPSIQRMAYGSTEPPEMDGTKVLVVPPEEKPLINQAIKRISAVANDPVGFPKCHQFFAEECHGNKDTLKKTFDAATLWKWPPKTPNAGGAIAETPGHNIAYMQFSYNQGVDWLSGALMHELLHNCGGGDDEHSPHRRADVARVYCMGAGKNEVTAKAAVDTDKNWSFLISYRRLIHEWLSGRLQLNVGADINVIGLLRQIDPTERERTPTELGSGMLGLRKRANIWGAERYGGLLLTADLGFGADRFKVRTPNPGDRSSVTTGAGVILQLGARVEFWVPDIGFKEGRVSALSLEAGYRLVQPLTSEAQQIHEFVFGLGGTF